MVFLSGSLVALVTPFTADGTAVDLPALERLVERQIRAGTVGLVPTGTTGETPTLTAAEGQAVIAATVRIAAGRVKVIAGVGTNNTLTTIAAARMAADAGADAVMIACPPYNRPGQEGLFLHYQAIHDATRLPIVIYNIPGRSAVDMSVETMARLARLPRIVAVKDATADLTRPLKLRLAAGPGFAQLSGEDATLTGFLAQGGHGWISVTANVAPAECAALYQSWVVGDLQQMAQIRDLLMPLHQAMFCENSPAPAKYALSRLGLCAATVRLPLAPLSPAGMEQIDRALAHLGLTANA